MNEVEWQQKNFRIFFVLLYFVVVIMTYVQTHQPWQIVSTGIFYWQPALPIKALSLRPKFPITIFVIT